MSDEPSPASSSSAGSSSAGAGPPGLALFVASPSRSYVVPLPEHGTLVLGRGVSCALRIEDARLSREHAELRIAADGRIELVDLGSMNGTFVRDAHLAPNVPVPLMLGEAVTIGSTVLVLRRETHAARRHVSMGTHEEFLSRLDDECARATRGGPPVAVLRVRLSGVATDATTIGGGSDRMLESLSVLAQTAHFVALYAPNEYEALLSGATAERAESLAVSIRAIDERYQVAVAAHPRHGRTPEALIEHVTRGFDSLRGVVAGEPVLPPGALEELDPVLERVAPGEISILIFGETGVGKEVLAHRVHERSARATKPFVSINCAALTESLAESELFGHERGAFTGAATAKQGLLESAEGGTVFLDEIGEMPLGLQAKLLRVVEQREVTRVGALRPRPINVRFVSATNRDLEGAIGDARFRQDLYFRLSGVTLTIPPLRERAAEIEPLARAFAQRTARGMGQKDAPDFSPEALDQLRAHAWPGNVRELRNVVERAVLLSGGATITPKHLPAGKARPAAPPASSKASGPGTVPAPDDPERRRVVETLEQCGGNQREAAKRLGIARGTLIRRMEEMGIARPRKR